MTDGLPSPQTPLMPNGQPLPYGRQPVTHWKRSLILDRYGEPLPTDRCFKCDAPADRVKTKTLYWSSPLFILLILANILVYIIVVLLVRKNATVHLGLCQRCARRPWIVSLFWFAAAVSTIFLMARGIKDAEAGLFALGIGLFFAILVAWLLTARLVVAVKIDDRWIHLKGAGKAFRSRFPTPVIDRR